jgi:beta-galactosidase
MVQSENEYGSYAKQTHQVDTKYLIHMRDLIRKHLGPDVLLYSTDGCSTEDVSNSKTNGVYSTVDFGSNENVTQCFQIQSACEPGGPLVNSEYYPGWLDNWGLPHNIRSTKVFKLLTLLSILRSTYALLNLRCAQPMLCSTYALVNLR